MEKPKSINQIREELGYPAFDFPEANEPLIVTNEGVTFLPNWPDESDEDDLTD